MVHFEFIQTILEHRIQNWWFGWLFFIIKVDSFLTKPAVLGSKILHTGDKASLDRCG